MILQRLCEYYDRLAPDPDADVAPPGTMFQSIAFALVLENDGSLHAIQDLRVHDGTKPRALRMLVPECDTRTSAIRPQFLWDKSDYLLGWAAGAKSPDRVRDAHAACKSLHEEAFDEHQTALGPLRSFFHSWTPDQLGTEQLELLEEVDGGFGVLRIRGQRTYIHDDEELRRWWRRRRASNDKRRVRARCLITGEESDIARLHPLIKGVRDAKSSGAGIVSFNRNAFESYGHQQGANAPIGTDAAFRYTTALNHLLRRDSGQRLQVGDSTVVFWSERPAKVADCDAEELLLWGLGGNDADPSEDAAQSQRIGEALSKLKDGLVLSPDAGVGFFVLGLAPNNSRLSVRLWEESTLSQLFARVGRHLRGLDIVRSRRDREHLPLWVLLLQCARESKEVPPLLGGALLRSVLTGSRYPDAILSAALRRIRAGDDIGHPRAALIKAILIRNHDKEIPVMLDETRPEAAYQLGRLFAVLEKAQEDALSGINATVKDRYFGAASSTPATVFPRLIRGSQHHIHKLEGGAKVNAEKRIQAVMERIENFPSHLNLLDQGLFAIGYYHQRQALFTKKAGTRLESK